LAKPLAWQFRIVRQEPVNSYYLLLVGDIPLGFLGAMQKERRKEKRTVILKACWIVTDSNNNPRECKLRDISGQGARISCDEPDQMPDRIILLFTQDGKAARVCKVIWRSDKEFAVQFLGKTHWKASELVPLDT
jgi:hypothetical protein